MRAGMVLLTLVVVLLLAGAVPVAGVDATAVFGSPAFLLLMGLVVVALVIAAARRRRSLRWIAVATCHLAVVLVLAGSLLTHLGSVTRKLALVDGGPAAEVLVPPCRAHQVQLARFFMGLEAVLRRPIDIERQLDRLRECDHPEADGWPLALGFPVAITRCRVERYPAGDDGQPGPAGMPPPIRQYHATLVFGEGAAAVRRPISVNHPVDHLDGLRGYRWRFFLENFRPLLPGRPANHPGQAWVVDLIVRHDPGRPWVVAGLWALLAGVASCCWTKGQRPEVSGQRAQVRGQGPSNIPVNSSDTEHGHRGPQGPARGATDQQILCAQETMGRGHPARGATGQQLSCARRTSMGPDPDA